MITKIILIFLILNWNNDVVQAREGLLKFSLSDIPRDNLISKNTNGTVIQQGNQAPKNTGGNFIQQNIHEPKIINGTEAEWDGTRYQVSLRIKNIDTFFFGDGHICGGSLITQNIVLSAAHCFWDNKTGKFLEAHLFSVVMGNLNRLEQTNTLIFNVNRYSLFPTFNIITLLDDIAIVFLCGRVPTNFLWAHTIELNEEKNLPEGTRCIVSGWGLMETNEYATYLMEVDIPIISVSRCRKYYGRIIQKGMMCAGYMEGEYDSCVGDSGGPLNCNNKLVGVVSFGYKCGLPRYPGVYSEVAHYLQWIRKEIGFKSQRGAGSGSKLTSNGLFLNLFFIFTFCRK